MDFVPKGIEVVYFLRFTHAFHCVATRPDGVFHGTCFRL